MTLILGVAFLAGVLAAEVACMLLERQFYAAALACFIAVVLMITARRLSL